MSNGSYLIGTSLYAICLFIKSPVVIQERNPLYRESFANLLLYRNARPICLDL